MTFTIHKIRIVIPNGTTIPTSTYDDEIGEYIADYDECDYDAVIIVFGQKEAWTLYRKVVNDNREKHGAFTVEIYSALLTEGTVISGHHCYDDDMKQPQWELLDRTCHKPRRK